MKIGNVEVSGKCVLAPMAGITNSAFRRIAKEYGCSMVYAEMVSDKAIYYNNKKTIDMLYMMEEERPIVQQVFGSDKESFVAASKYICDVMKPDILDINMGCPVPKVAVSAQAGASLLKDLDKIYDIVSNVVKSVNVPVSVKIRSGWDSNSINAVEVAKVCEKAGASLICVHPRTRSQGYSGNADWSIIRDVKNSVSIPVIGNGDIKNCFDAKKMIDVTGCDMVMVGRAALGNPFIFREINEYLESGKVIDKVSDKERIDTLIRNFKYLLEFKSEHLAMLEIRSHVGWYLKGMRNSSEIRNKIFVLDKVSDIMKLLEEYKYEME